MGIAWQQVMMAAFLWLFGVWAILVGLGPGMPDGRYVHRERQDQTLLWKLGQYIAWTNPGLYRAIDRVFAVLGGAAFVAGGFLILLHDWSR